MKRWTPQARFLLVGEDFEGESREMWADNYAAVLSMAEQCASRFNYSGPPWRFWSIWANDAAHNHDWRPIAASQGRVKVEEE